MWWQLAVLVVTTLISYAMQPKAQKDKPPTITDLDVPVAEEGRPIPVVFGSPTITGPTIGWYGDYGVETKTKNKVKTRSIYLGLHWFLCHGPINLLRKITAGGKLAWSGRVSQSGSITISASNLFGGRSETGGIAGQLDVLFGESTQTTNAYLESVQGAPQPGYRGVASLVFRKGLVSANTTTIEPWAFRVKRTSAGWYGDECWQPDLVECDAGGDPEAGDAAAVHSIITEIDPGLYFRFDRYGIADGEECANSGSAPISGTYRENCVDADPILPELTAFHFASRSLDLNGEGYIQVPPDPSFCYWYADVMSVGIMLRAGDSWSDHEYLFHQGDKTSSANFGLSVQTNYGTIHLIYRSTDLTVEAVHVTLAEEILPGDVVCLGIVVSRTGGANGTGYLRVYRDCTLQGTADFPSGRSVKSTTSDLYIAARNQGGSQDLYLHATMEYFFIVDRELDVDDWSQLADAAGTCATTFPHMNPAHIIYQAITDPEWGMGLPSAMIDSVSFGSAAQTFYDEGFGLTFQWVEQEPIEDFIQRICDHAGAILSQDPGTGKFTLTAIRADYVAGDLPLFDETNCMVERFERAGYGELIGEVNVVYRDWQTNVDATVKQQNLAVIQSQSGVVSETVQYPAIPTASLAYRVAARDLAARSVPLARGAIRCNRAAWGLTPGQCFRLSWGDLGIVTLVCRIGSIDYGTLTDGAITVEWVEDVFGLPDATYAAEQPTGWTDPVSDPLPASAQEAIELPRSWLAGSLDTYALSTVADDSGYGLLLAAQPATISDRFELWRSANAAPYALVNDDGQWSPTTTLGADVARADVAITLAAVFGDLEIDDLLLVGTGTLAEIMRVAVVDGVSVSVSRGIYDTTPQIHAAGARVWLLPEIAIQDETVYTDGDEVDYKALTVTSTQTLDIVGATAEVVTMASRQIRPYAPGNVAIDGTTEGDADADSFPSTVSGAMTISWSHRDRLVQGVAPITQSNATDYGPEAGTTYEVYLYDDDTNALVASATGIAGTSHSFTAEDYAASENYNARLEIAAVRDGYECWQRQVREFTHGIPGLISEDGMQILRDDDGGVITRG